MRRRKPSNGSPRALAPCAGCPPSPGGREDALARRLRDGVELLVRRFSISERADVACCGMTVAQAAALEALQRNGPQRLCDLSRRLGIAPSTLTRNLTRLEERRLVDREPDPGDSRALRATLTSAGRAAAVEVEQQEIDFARAVLARIDSTRRRDTVRSVETLLAAILEATEACCPGAFEHLVPNPGKPPGSSRRNRR